VGVCRHLWGGLLVVDENGEEDRGVDWLTGKSIYAACAIGNPGPFLEQARWRAGHVKSTGLAGSLVLRDHAEFGPEVVSRLVEELKALKADVLLVTEKDWSKLMKLPAETWPCPVARPQVALSLTAAGLSWKRRS